MALNTSNTSTAERLAMAFAAAVDSIAKVPDYHLPYTGDQTSFAIKKILELDLHGVGGIYILDSTKENPANLDTVADPGKYVANYVTATGIPPDVAGCTPVSMDVFTKDGYIFQLTDSMGDLYYRYSNDGGNTWSIWIPKSSTSGGLPIIPEGQDPTIPPKDAITIINEHLTKIDGDITTIQGDITNIKRDMLHLGPEATATAMLAKTFDYDAAPAAARTAGEQPGAPVS